MKPCGLDNLVAIVVQKMLTDGPDEPHLEPLVEKSKAFGWSCVEIDRYNGGDFSVLSRWGGEALPSMLKRDRFLR